MDVVAIGENGIVRNVVSMVPRVLRKDMIFTCVMNSTRISVRGTYGGVFVAAY